METGIESIAKERQEQIEKHNRTLKHDDKHTEGELADAAVVCASNRKLYDKFVYANNTHFDALIMSGWELPLNYHGNVLLDNYKSTKKKRIHQLKVAGALIAAEIDRLRREK